MPIEGFVLGLGCLLLIVALMPLVASRVRLPYSVLLAIVGFLLGLLLFFRDLLPPVFSHFLQALSLFQISSEAFLYIFLPVLLFETALSMKLRRLMDDAGPILLMAIVAVVVCTLAVGWVLSAVSGYSLMVCLLLGAIVATTDPVAVVGIFKEVGAPQRLSNLVEGEALFNDAASIALYSVLLTLLIGGGALSASEVVQRFLFSFAGGIAVGVVIGLLAGPLFVRLRSWPAAEVVLTLALAYLSFFVAEVYIHVSGVVATVIAGLVVGHTGRVRMTPTTFDVLQRSWSQLGFVANSFIFLLAAMLIPELMRALSWKQVGLTLLLFVITLLARAVMVFGVLPILGLTPLAAKVSRPFRVVILWGGLRGAVSLALALAVTEQYALSDEVRQFIAMSTTGFVLLTLFINGPSLRPLIRFLGLDKPTAVEAALRDQAVVVTLGELHEQLHATAQAEPLPATTVERLQHVFQPTLSAKESKFEVLSLADRTRVGMAILSAREVEMCYEILRAQLVDWRRADGLLARAERLNDAVLARGVAGFEAGIADDLRYSLSFRLALRLQMFFGVKPWLRHEIEQRFASLTAKRWVAGRIIRFAEHDVAPLLGQDAAEALILVHRKRLSLLDTALHTLSLQYPAFAEWLQEQYVGGLIKSQERERYQAMRDHSLLTPEMHNELLHQAEQRWAFLKHKPELDHFYTPAELLAQVPLFAQVDPRSLKTILHKLRPQLLLPQQRVPMQVGKQRAIYFVASGAVALTLPDGSVMEMGTGQSFGESYVLERNMSELKAVSLGYSRLLRLLEKDFEHLLASDPAFKAHVDQLMAQRKYAYEVWQRFEATQAQSAEPSPIAQPVPDTDML